MPCYSYFSKLDTLNFGRNLGENQKLDKPNEVIGITASVSEHRAYVRACFKERGLMKYYKVIFGDIYTLTCRCLPLLDIVHTSGLKRQRVAYHCL